MYKLGPVSESLKEMDELTKDEQIQAVLTRDSSYDGLFVYGVKTTSIYCRPSCPSKRPSQENIQLFKNPPDAEASGYRPCLRCDPYQYHNPNEIFVAKITNYISNHLIDKITLDTLANQFNISKYHLQKTFKTVLGITPRQYLESKRLEDFKKRIKDGEKVDKAMYDSGFKSRSRLYEKVSEKLGMTPTKYRNGGLTEQIMYTVFTSSMTKVLVARTDRGICALYMGDDEKPLIDSLTEEYPYAQITRDEEELNEVVGSVESYFEGRDFNPRLPLDIHRTVFQWKVLKAIQMIPAGKIMTYSKLADTIGNPKAVRAVANACARNPVALLIPCHRVVRKNGELGGYRWGIPLKRKLLEHEHQD